MGGADVNGIGPTNNELGNPMGSRIIRAARTKIKFTDEMPEPAAVTASVDTIEIRLGYAPKGLRKEIESVTGKRAHIVTTKDDSGYPLYHRVIENRPDKATVAMLSKLLARPGLYPRVSRVDVAYDFKMKDELQAYGMADWQYRHLILKWRSPRAIKIYYKTTIYWADENKPRNLALYPKFLKNPEYENVVRLELRFQKSHAVKRAGLDDLENLQNIDPKKLLHHNIKAERVTERHIANLVRRTCKEDRVAHRLNPKRRGHQVIDNYRSMIPDKVRSTLTRIGAQNLGRIVAKEKVDTDWLNIPNRITWPG